MLSLSSLLSCNTIMQTAETISNTQDRMGDKGNILDAEIDLAKGRGNDMTKLEAEKDDINNKIAR